MTIDCVIIGGGPGGLAAALALGRARKRVLLVDAGPRRNAAATNLHNFVTQDGTPPDAFRAVGRQQLATYPNVEVQDVGVVSIAGARGAFRITLSTDATIAARRALLCTGMIDELLPIEGFRELWGRSIFQCPYCHGWEARDRPWGYLVLPASLPHAVPFALQARGWTPDLTVFTYGAGHLCGGRPRDAHARRDLRRIRRHARRRDDQPRAADGARHDRRAMTSIRSLRRAIRSACSRLALLVGASAARAIPDGAVIATDIKPDMVRYLEERARREQLANLHAVQATPTSSGLAARSVDAILADQYIVEARTP